MPASDKKTPSLSEFAGRMYRLFAANQRSVGVFDPKTSKVRTLYRGPVVQDFVDHLETRNGVGCVPIMDTDECSWAAIDIDNHGQDEDIPIAPVAAKIRQMNLPLVPCRSKSGGIHAYLFLATPQPASRIRPVMARWADLLGFKGSEVFPKQSHLLSSKEGKKQFGNWINLPYLAADATQRYAFWDGSKLSLAAFLDLAEKRRATDKDLAASVIHDHGQAPPCVQRMLAEGVGSGHRNEALFQITVYLRKRSPDDYETAAREISGVVFDKPLPRAEMQRTVSSAGRPDYGYRCSEEPARSFCDRDTCIKRKFGISRDEANQLATAAILPAFSDLVKYLSEPVRWELKLDGQLITNIATVQLLDFRFMRELIAEKLTRVVPRIKDVEWERHLAPLMKEARLVETPSDASVAGVVREKLREFASKTDLTNRGEDTNDRRALLRGMPVVQMYEGERMVMFRSMDFVNYLKRNRAEELKGVNLWFAVRGMGVGHTKLRAGDHNVNIWYMPVKEVLEDRPPTTAPKFKSKL